MEEAERETEAIEALRGPLYLVGEMWRDSKLLKSGTAMFGVGYNLINISVVVVILEYRYGTVSTFVESALDSVILVGIIVGMLIFGFLGDVIGRSTAYVATLMVTVIGVIACGGLSFGPRSVVEGVIVATRFVVGIGLGGVYPLAGVETSEASAGVDKAAFGLFCMSLGFMLPYLLGWIASFFPGATTNNIVMTAQLHTYLLIGAVPALCVLPLAMRHEETSEFQHSKSSSNLSLKEAWELLGENSSENNNLKVKLFGCMAVYFLYDMAAYWIGIYETTILDAIMPGDTFRHEMMQNMVASFSVIPAGALSIYLLVTKRVSTSGGLIFGFTYMGVSFIVLEYVWDHVKANWIVLMFFLNVRASTWFLNVFGCYLLPVQIFPARCRSTLAGACNASGKLGAIVGTFVIPNLVSSDDHKFTLCATGSLVAAAIGYFVLHPSTPVPLPAKGNADDEPKAEPTESEPLLEAAGADPP